MYGNSNKTKIFNKALIDWFFFRGMGGGDKTQENKQVSSFSLTNRRSTLVSKYFKLERLNEAYRLTLQ